MEALAVMIGLAILAAVGLAPILALVALVRTSRALSEAQRLRADLGMLEARLGGLLKRFEAERAGRHAVVEEVVPTTPPPAPSTTPPPAQTIAPPIPATSAIPPAAPVPPLPPSPAAPSPEPLRVVAASRPAARSTSAAAPAAPAAPARPTPAPPSPPAESPNWESLLGVKGAAWVGGFALVVTAILLAKLAVDRGLVTPALRVAILIVSGVGLLAGSEWRLRRGYSVTANALCGAGIAILYAAFFAAHNLYGLIPMAAAFALMVLVTIVAGVFSIRHDSPAIAVLGLLGGFSTPILLSTGEDRPVGLFSYVLMLNLGLAAVALRRGWHVLMALALAGTTLLQLGWLGRFVRPGVDASELVIGAVVFLVFGLLYLLTGTLAQGRDSEWLTFTGLVGGLAPFLFAFYLGGHWGFASDPKTWPLLFLFVALLDAALLAVALVRGREVLLAAAAVATALVLPLWAVEGLSRDTVLGATVGALLIVVLINAGPRLASLFGATGAQTLDVAAWIATGGLGLFGLMIVKHDLGEPIGPFLLALVGLTALIIERSAARRIEGAYAVAAVGVAILIQAWFFRSTDEDSLLTHLTVPLLFPIVLSLVAALRVRRAGRNVRRPIEVDVAVIDADGIALLGLLFLLGVRALARDPGPPFVALAVGVGLLVVTAIRRGWTGLLPVGLGISVLFTWIWHAAYFQPGDVGVALAIYSLFYLAFLTLPFMMPEPLAGLWRQTPWPWLTSAFAGPLFFPALYDAVTRGLGKGAIGLLPLALAGLSVVALAGISQGFVERRGDEESGRLRLRYLALFAALALGFVAVAIPVQLDRQWITIGWAVEAAAVWWLYGRLPHRGLTLFGAGLFAAVGVRLLVNPEVLRYAERGLPIFNWLLYSYGVPAVCCFLGAGWLKDAEARRAQRAGGLAAPAPTAWLAPAAVSLGILLVFWLINLEIADAFSTGRFVELSFERRYARDMTTSVAWGLYALTLLVAGLARRSRALRFVSLGVMMLTVGKVFLYDLSTLRDVYRVFSFLGLGIALIVISLLYQRFVFREEPRR